jgi:hypothetical protein
MSENIKIGITASSNGTLPKVEKEASGVQEQLAKAAANSEKLNSSLKASKALQVAAAARPQPSMSGQEYGSARGSAGLTGASARDFANQSQGLGGLVRLYATYAANVFAVGAAFTALKNAADTTNLIKGLDTLGAASGQNLGSLSKRLVEVTNGAVSMREAMEATAKASSAGMSSKDIERLGLVAKNASLALGVAMPDALSRISRGIVKLEPELLDELGLFTKIGPATEKYALELGKSVSSLTDFERRQAFANAVLTEGEKKFGALAEAAANPYDKLLSSLKNILQSGGELINKVLTPIIGLLANSPTALAAVLAGIGYVLLKQALPAIGQLRAGLRSTAEEALATAEAFKSSFGDKFQTILEKRFKVPDLEVGVKKAEADLAKLNVPSKLAPSVAKLAAGDETSLKNVEAALKRKNALIDGAASGTRKASEAQIAAAKQEILYLQKVIDLYNKKQVLAQATKAEQGQADMPIGRFDPEVIALQKYQKLRAKVDQANAISNAAEVAGVAGIRSSWDLLNKEVAEKNIKGFAKYSTLAQGGLAALGTRVMGIVGSLGYLGQGIALVTGAFAILDGWFSKNAKQAEVFNKALDTSEESVANVARTLQAATNVEGYGSKTIANTVALSNAFNELTTSAREALKTEKAAAAAASGWDKFWNVVFSVAGKDRSSKLADSIAKQISSSIDILSREGLADEYATEIKKILNVTNLKDIDSVARAWKNLSTDQQASVLAIQENSNRALGNASSALQNFKDKTDSALTAYKTFTNSFVDTSPLFKLGEAYIDVGQSLAELANAGPNRLAQAFEELANNSQKAALLGKDFVKAFAPIADQFLKQKANLDALNISLQTQIEARKNLISASRVITTESGAAIITPNMGRRGRENTEAANERIRETNRLASATQAQLLETGTKVLVEAGKKAIETGMALINRSIANARTTADIGISKVLSSVLTGPRKLEAEDAIRQRELRLQLEDLKISETLINVQATLVDEMRLANALQAESNALQKGDKTGIARTNIDVQKARAAVGQTEGIDEGILASAKAQQEQNEQRRTKSLESKRIAITGEMQQSTLSTQLQMPGATLQQQEQLAKITDRKLAAERASFDVLTSIAGVTSTTAILAKQAAEASALKNAQEREIAVITKDIQTVELARSKAQPKDVARYEAELLVLKGIKTQTEAAQKAETDTTGLKNRQELLAQEIKNIDNRYETTKSTGELENIQAKNVLDIRSEQLRIADGILNFSKEYIINQEAELAADRAKLDTANAIQQAEDAIAKKREQTEAKIIALRGKDYETAQALQDELSREVNSTDNTVAGLKSQLATRLKITKSTKDAAIDQEKLNKSLEEINKRYEVQRSAAETQQAILTSNIELRSSELNIFGSLYDMSKDYLINQQAIVDKEKLLLDTTSAMQSAQDSLSQKREEAELKIQSLRSATSAVPEAQRAEEEQRIRDELTRQEQLTNNTLTGLNAQFVSRSQILELTKQANLEQEKYNQLIKDAEGISKNLTTIFGEVGTAIGGAVKALGDLVVTSNQNAKAQEKLNKELEAAKKGPDRAKETAAQGALDKQKRKGLKDELDGISTVAGETKKMFKEKTGAFKVLAAVEKATAIASMALKMQDFAVSLTTLPAKIAGGVAQLFNQGGFAGFVGAGAFLALMASLGAKSSGGGTSAPAFSANSEQIQETMGTGTTYNSKGEKVADVGGILGDDTAKANSVVTSLEILKNNSFESLDYDNKLLRSFQNVAAAIGKATNTVLTSGLRNVDINLASSLGTKVSGGGLMDSIFGGKTSQTKSIVSQRLELSGTFGAVADDIGSGLRQVTDALVTWTKSGGWFSKNKSGSYVESLVGEVPEDINKAFSDIFKSFKQGYQDIAEMMGMDDNNALTFVSSKLNTVELKDSQGNPLKFDYTGLKGDEVKTELEAYFSKINNIALKALFPEFSAFETAGEDYGTTVIRVLQNTKQVELALISIGNASSSAMRGLSGFGAADALIEVSGGLEAFVDNTKFFASNFLTEAERLVPVQAAVTKQLKDLGYESIETRDQFKQLIQTFDLTDPKVYKTYAALMTVQKGFIEVTAAAQKEADERVALNKKLNQLGKTQAELREQELENLFAGNRELQKEIWLKEDQIAAGKALQASLKGVTSNIKSQITSLQDYKTSLQAGTNSTLTASQKYRDSKTEIEGLVSVINKTAITPEEIESRNKALGRFSGASDKFLSNSRELFASSAQYTTDFNSILSIIDKVNSGLEDQLTDAEKQLGALEASNGYLQDISANSKTTAQLLEAFLSLGGQANSTATISASSNFVPQSTTAQAPVADNLGLMLNVSNPNRTNEVLVAEIKKLNEKISSLERTVAEGAIINADATNRNTEQIAQAVVDSSGKTIQANTLQAKASIKS